MKYKSLLVIALCLPITLASFGRNVYRNSLNTNSISHHMGLIGGVGYGAIWDDYSEISTIGNVCGTLGCEYELKVNGFWLSVGAEIQYFSSKALFNTTGTDVKILDTYGVPATYHYNFNRGEDLQEMIFANVPITLGYYYRGLYIGAGIKAGYAIYNNEKTYLNYTTTGSYDEYIDDFQQMANHSYGTYDSHVSQKIPLTYKVSLLGEIGYDVLFEYRIGHNSFTDGMKISLCAEYGLNNLIKDKNDVPLYTFNKVNATELHINPFYYSRAGNSHSIHPFYAGVKITWLWCVGRKHTCNCH